MHLEKYYLYVCFDNFASEADRLKILEEDFTVFQANQINKTLPEPWADWVECPAWFDETNTNQAETILAAKGFDYTSKDQGFSYTLAIVYCAAVQPPKAIYLLTEDGFKVF